MSGRFHLDIITAEGTVFRADAEALVAPAEFGYLGVLANHAPLIARLQPGKVIVRDGAGVTRLFRSEGGGLLEVLKNNVMLVLEAVTNL